jgi:hypothetical protein
MFETDIKIDNELKTLSNRLGDGIPKQLIGDLEDELVVAGNDIRNRIIEGMQDTPKTGTIYTKKGGRRHIASSPGNFPAVDTGDLISNIVVDETRKGVEVGSILLDPPVGSILEDGTRNMKKRPWMEPTIDEISPVIEFNIQEALLNSIKRVRL